MNQEVILVLRAVIKSPKGILVIQREKRDRWNPGDWEFPGGKFGKGTLKSNLRREVIEETGLVGVDFGGLRLIKISISQGELKEYRGKLIITLYFLGFKNKKYKVKLSREHQASKWIKNLGDVSGLTLKEDVLDVLNCVGL